MTSFHSYLSMGWQSRTIKIFFFFRDSRSSVLQVVPRHHNHALHFHKRHTAFTKKLITKEPNNVSHFPSPSLPLSTPTSSHSPHPSRPPPFTFPSSLYACLCGISSGVHYNYGSVYSLLSQWCKYRILNQGTDLRFFNKHHHGKSSLLRVWECISDDKGTVLQSSRYTTSVSSPPKPFRPLHSWLGFRGKKDKWFRQIS